MTKEQRAEAYAKERFKPDWAGGVDENASWRCGTVIGYIEGFTQAADEILKYIHTTHYHEDDLIAFIKALASEKGEK